MHLAIIMDGNGRWATNKGLSRLEGHKKGSETLKNISLYCSEKKRNVDYLTVYAFSVQNWGRPKEEIFALFSLIKTYFNDIELFNKRNIRIRTQGYIYIYPKDILDTIKNAVNITKNNTGLTLTIVLSYGGREEIVDAVNEMITDGINNINMNNLSCYIEKDNVPNPDLIIRTSGEFRTSNFLLWQSAYSEYLFTDTYWPDFSEKELDNALELYCKRSRRFGLVDTRAVIAITENALQNEEHCRFFIEQIINKKQQDTLRVDRYKEKSLLRSKYFNIINNMLIENTLTDAPEIVAKEAEKFGRKLIPNKTESFYKHINTWTEWIFLTDNIIDENNLKIKCHNDFKNIILDDLTIVDIHKLFRKYIKSDEIEETLKTKMFELNAKDISLYKCIIRNDIKRDDYISRIIVFFYIIFPILEDILSMDIICLIAIMSTILDDIEDGDNEIPLDIYEVLESVLISFEQNDSIQVNNSITIKIKTALIYLILFSLQRTNHEKNKKITFSMLFNYLQMLF